MPKQRRVPARIRAVAYGVILPSWPMHSAAAVQKVKLMVVRRPKARTLSRIKVGISNGSALVKVAVSSTRGVPHS
jgi:hypothetical protein